MGEMLVGTLILLVGTFWGAILVGFGYSIRKKQDEENGN